MVNFYSILTLYYIAVITGIFFHCYFAKFIASDFQNNRSLRVKLRFTIAYYYIMGFFSIYFIHFTGDIDLGWLNDSILIVFIIGSIFFIIILYGYMTFSLEKPKTSHKKRKWK